MKIKKEVRTLQSRDTKAQDYIYKKRAFNFRGSTKNLVIKALMV